MPPIALAVRRWHHRSISCHRRPTYDTYEVETFDLTIARRWLQTMSVDNSSNSLKAMRSMLVTDRSARINKKPLNPVCTMTRRLTALAIAAAAVLSADAFVPSPSTSAGRAAFATSLEARADGLGEDSLMSNVGKAIATAALALAVFDPSPAFADGQTEKFKLPPIDKNDKMRCQFNDSKMGQANAQRDKVRVHRSVGVAINESFTNFPEMRLLPISIFLIIASLSLSLPDAYM